MVETREFFDAFSATQYKDDQGLAPPRATDPGWAHGIMVNGGRQKIKCKYCHKVILGGGISRLKQHLAGERGNVAPCEEVPEDVKVQIQQHLGFKVLEKLQRQKGLKSSKNSVSYFQSSEEGDDEVERNPKTTSTRGASRKRRGKEVDEGTSNRTKKHKKHFFPMAIPVVQPPIHQSFASQESIDQADMAVAKFMYDAGIPFSASNSYYFQKMADAIAAAGPGYKMPSYHSLRGKLLNRSVQDAGELYHELKKSWEVTGCSVMVDRWTDRTDRTVINFFVYCPKGTVFLKSVDATDITKSSEELLSLFDSVVQEVGPKHVVNFVTDTAPSYKAAGKALMGKYRTFFWSACSAHCIDLMLKEMGEMDDVKEVLAKAKQITRFIYNNAWVLNLMRKRTGGRDIVQLAITRFASSFLTLQTIVSLKGPLHQMFTSATWMHSTFSKQRAGVEVAEIVVDLHFWSLCDRTLKVTKPLLTVLHLNDCEDRPSVGYIYDAMEKAKKNIILAFNNKESDYSPYLNVIDRVWQEELHSPLHAAGCYLNPSIFYNPTFSTNKVIQKGLLDCIETLEPNLNAQVMITSHINFYEDAVGDFGRPVALRGRESLAPATWWSLYAADYPDLQRLAVRVLSQTCSTTQCERSWSMFEYIQGKKRNRLEHKKLNNLIFVHYNLRLHERREASKARSIRGACDPICLEAVDVNVGDWVEDPASTEGEDISWMDVTIPSERTSLSFNAQSIDICNDNTDDRCSDDTKDIDGNNDL
uniref:BED-type domain-containing protein n=1 Tax=Davidia involucrata TaxID=16924 RepID=A0A5B7CBF9_DAVIN